MKRLLLAAFAALTVAFASAPGFAQDKSKGTAAEATAMVEKAIAHIKKVGRDQAFADFSSKKAPWVDRDLYVVVYDMKGKDRKSTRLNSSHVEISYAVFCLKKKT